MVNDTQQIPAGYKQTDVGIIPEDWEVKRLGDIGESIIGLTYSPSDVSRSGLLVHRSSNIQNNKLSYLDNVYVNKKVNEKLILRKKDILICVRNGSRDLIGKSALIVGKSVGETFGAFMSVYRVNENQDYIFYLITSDVIQSQINQSLGATINQITNKTLNDFIAPFPNDPNEATTISKVLFDIDSLISKLDQLIQKKKNIKQGAMQELLTGKRRLPGFSGEWVEKKLDQIADFYKGSGLSKSKIVNDGKYPCILYGELFTTYSEVINQVISHTNAIEGLTSKKGDVLLPGSTTTSGIDLATASSLEVENVLLGGDMIVLRKKTNEAFNSKFLAHYLTHISKYKIAEISQGITIIHLHGSRLKDISIFVPSDIKEQDSISRIIVEMSSEILLLESQRKKYQDLKQGMMQQLLTGKIRLI